MATLFRLYSRPSSGSCFRLLSRVIREYNRLSVGVMEASAFLRGDFHFSVRPDLLCSLQVRVLILALAAAAAVRQDVVRRARLRKHLPRDLYLLGCGVDSKQWLSLGSVQKGPFRLL